MIPLGIFFIFSKFWLFGLLKEDVKEQKMVQNEKKLCLLHSISQESYIIWFSFMVLMYKWYLLEFFSFFSKFWLSGLLGQKIAQNDKKLCLLCLISQEPYVMWSSFVVHKCKMIISPVVFFYFFKILIFWVLRRVKGQKWRKMTKNVVLCILYLRNHTSYDLDLCYMWCACVKGLYLQGFFTFFPNFKYWGQ